MITRWLIRHRDAAGNAWLLRPDHRPTYRRLAVWDTLLTLWTGKR